MTWRAANLALALCLAATPGAALTCLPPTVERAFTAAQAAREIYVPVLGIFTGFRQRREAQSVNGPDRRFTARFEGRYVTATGPGGALHADVAVTETCLGSWCPVFPPDVPVLTFLERTADGYRIEVDACHGNYFADPSPDQVKAMRTCLKSMACDDW